MKRGVVVYLEKKYPLLLQFSCLYTSLKYIQSNNTDLVVFGPQDVLEYVPDDCVKVEFAPLSEKYWQEYRYMNSISMFSSEKSKFLMEYDLLLRTDLDVFLTPAWNFYYPEIYTVGQGGYVNDEKVKKNLKGIAKKLSLNHKGIYNIGSTHYGPPELLRKVFQLTFEIAEYIYNIEFKNDPGEWPSWYRGVTLLYATEIAVNHLLDEFCLDKEKLDYPSTSEGYVNNHPHIHCWHTDKIFSKFKFINGEYDKIHTDDLDIKKVKNYCLYIALKAKKEMDLGRICNE